MASNKPANVLPTSTTEAILRPSTESFCSGRSKVQGYIYEDEDGKPNVDYKQLLDSLYTTGFQATHYGIAVEIINQMLSERAKPFSPDLGIEDVFIRPATGCTIFLSYTSNMISSGVRETIRFLVKNKLIDCIVTTAGGIEEDLIKSLHCDTYIGDFQMNGSHLRENGINRIGNLLVNKPANVLPTSTTEAILRPSTESFCSGRSKVQGYIYEDEDGKPNVDYKQLLDSLYTTGFQATHYGIAVEIINQMLSERAKPFSPDLGIEDVFIRPATGCTIFLSYTSNMISSGVRETIRFLVKNKLIDCIVTTAGGIEEDLIKSLHCDTYIGDFQMNGSHLRENGINRIGNLLVPNANYCRFEEWLIPILDKMLAEQKAAAGELVWSPSKVIERLGLEIDNEDSVCYWAAKNKIPIFCPALTDGSLGDMLHFHTFRSPGLLIDVVSDMRRISTFAHNTESSKTGAIILGGGVAKHHTMNANLMRNGANFTVYINTASEFDGSDSGAGPDEAVSWGKVKNDAKSVKVTCDATIAFPLLVASTFVDFARNTTK